MTNYSIYLLLNLGELREVDRTVELALEERVEAVLGAQQALLLKSLPLALHFLQRNNDRKYIT
jgi:hypothetical protein